MNTANLPSGIRLSSLSQPPTLAPSYVLEMKQSLTLLRLDRCTKVHAGAAPAALLRRADAQIAFSEDQSAFAARAR